MKVNIRPILLFLVLTIAGASCLTGANNLFAQNGNGNGIIPDTKSQAEIDGIIKAFSTKEARFKQALNEYAFRRDAVIQTIGLGGQSITGEYHRVSLFTFDDAGNRFE